MCEISKRQTHDGRTKLRDRAGSWDASLFAIRKCEISRTKKHRHPSKLRTSGVCPWYHLCLPLSCDIRPLLHGELAFAMHRPCNGSRFSGKLRMCPSPPTGIFRGRSVRGAARRSFSLAFPIPHHSYTRFSVSFLPGTCPCHRRWLFGCWLHHRESIRDCQGANPVRFWRSGLLSWF
jgi:hypothetical protein